MNGGISSLEAVSWTLGLVGKMGGLEAVAAEAVAPGELTEVDVEAVLIGGDTCLRLSVDSVFVPELDSP